MIANDASDTITSVGMLVGAIALLVLAVGLLFALVKSRKVTSHIVTKLGSIDVAVNNVAAGEPHLIEKVRRIEAAVSNICTHLNIPFHRDPDTRTRATDQEVTPA